MKKFLLLFSLFLLGCKEKELETKKLTQGELIIQKLKVKEEKDDSLANVRRLANINSIDYTSQNRNYIRPTLNFTINDLYNMTKSDIEQIDDFLINNNWIFVSKKEIKIGKYKSASGENPHYSIEETLYTYKNFANDSELTITIDKNFNEYIGKRMATFFIYTLNPLNYKNIIGKLNDLNFIPEQDDDFLSSDIKRYQGEIVSIDSNTKVYKKQGFEITATTFVNSTVTNSITKYDTINEMNDYNYYYDAGKTFNAFGISFNN